MPIRSARRDDLPAIVRLLADDPLGASRERVEDPLPAAYEKAFDAVTSQRGNDILVIEENGAVIGCLQLLVLPGLSHLGMTRAQIEMVRIDAGQRGRRLGEALVGHAIEAARAAGCGMVQLTTDKTRGEARRFYERLGYVASHDGMKLRL